MPLLVPCSMVKPRLENLRCPTPTFPRKILLYSQPASNAPKAQPNNAQCAQAARCSLAESAAVAIGQRSDTAQREEYRSTWRCSSSPDAGMRAIREPSSATLGILAVQPARWAARICAALALLAKQLACGSQLASLDGKGKVKSVNSSLRSQEGKGKGKNSSLLRRSQLACAR